MDYLHKNQVEIFQILEKIKLKVLETVKLIISYSYRKATIGSNLEAL